VYPFTGSRMMRASLVEGEQRLFDLWKTNCKYIKKGTAPIPGGQNGIYLPQNGNWIFEDIPYGQPESVPQSIVDFFYWRVQL
ncbi:unnamed protein product, partial [marine sediment metagenome]